MSSSSRKQRHPRRNLKPGDPTNQSIASSIIQGYGHSFTHPSNEIPPPVSPADQLLQQRATSVDSKISDISMDDFGATSTLESVLDYSDTSDDMREDAYFLPQQSPSSPSRLSRSHFTGRPHNPYQRNVGHSAFGESAFRELKRAGSKSSRVVQFSSQDRIDSLSNSVLGGSDVLFADKQDNSNFNYSSYNGQEHPSAELVNPTPKGKMPWMKKVACVLRSPSGIHDISNEHVQQIVQGRPQIGNDRGHNNSHNRTPSASTMEYAHALVRLPSQPKSEVTVFEMSSQETSPLLMGSELGSSDISRKRYDESQRCYHPRKYGNLSAKETKLVEDESGKPNHSTNGHQVESSMPIHTHQHIFHSRKMAARVAAYFLMDYEAGRPPILSSDFSAITQEQLDLYRLHFSWPWRNFVNLAILVLFLSHTQDFLATAIMHSSVIVVFAIEIRMREHIYGTDPKPETRHVDRKLVRPMIAFLFFLGLESWMWYFFSPQDTRHPIFSSLYKPLVFFYVSAKARDSLEALWRISLIVMRVLIVEFGLILAFASVACKMYGGHHESFHNLSTSWLSLFELSTTVVNPSLWMPIYRNAGSNSLFFVLFIVTCTFYYHSLVLSVVFQTYIQAVTEIHERSTGDREDAVRLAYLALMKDGQEDYINISSVRKCLQVVRPHYNALKMEALVEIIDPSDEHIIDYPTFRTKIRAALNASIRTARTSTTFAIGVELIAVIVAALNSVYVLAVSSEWNTIWFESCRIVLGAVITMLGLLELVIRFNPLRIQHFAPLTRLNPFFDVLALVAAFVSCVGIMQYAAGYHDSIETGRAVDCLLLGRAIDMIRVMRFFPIFRDVVARSSDVLPAMAGPLVLMLSVVHVFVFFGMVIWGGAVDVEVMIGNKALTPLYCLNNFNSYTQGLVTMFNIAVVNDWHAIAEVFLYADRNSHPTIVYAFFVGAICITVFIMLNVITAFFVESFVTTRHDHGPDQFGDTQEVNNRGFQIRTGENTKVKRVGTSTRRTRLHNSDREDDDPSSASQEKDCSVSSAASIGEVFSFDIYEREGFDQIMRTVAGASETEQEAFASNVCHYLEVFETLTSGREKVGYMICCQQSMNRFGNRRFRTLAHGFISDDTLHQVVSDMHSEVLVLSTKKKNLGGRCLVRSFPHRHDCTKTLEVAATLLRYRLAATLLVSRIRSSTDPKLSTGTIAETK